ncbi:hypothetical protein AWB76_04857 [Caballeronia temeraria]|uniref:Uncharacterized protein n=1 Tax=Caballeronia temeraria TaxID=1777137 RepID=A0A158BYD9_9BURK|nr:hypothetical protein AWB76_04857 [Caballeronia temeraria]
MKSGIACECGNGGMKEGRKSIPEAHAIEASAGSLRHGDHSGVFAGATRICFGSANLPVDVNDLARALGLVNPAK